MGVHTKLAAKVSSCSKAAAKDDERVGTMIAILLQRRKPSRAVESCGTSATVHAPLIEAEGG